MNKIRCRKCTHIGRERIYGFVCILYMYTLSLHECGCVYMCIISYVCAECVCSACMVYMHERLNVCVCACDYVCEGYDNVCACMYVCTCMCVYVCMCVRTVSMCICVCMYARKYVRTYMHKFVYMLCACVTVV